MSETSSFPYVCLKVCGYMKHDMCTYQEPVLVSKTKGIIFNIIKINKMKSIRIKIGFSNIYSRDTNMEVKDFI